MSLDLYLTRKKWRPEAVINIIRKNYDTSSTIQVAGSCLCVTPQYTQLCVLMPSISIS